MPKQTVLGRATQLARADVSTLLAQAEDPRKMADQLIREYARTIAQAEEAVAATIGGLRLMEQDRREDVDSAREWGQKALAASRKADELRAGGAGPDADRFDTLARVALGRQLQAEQEARTAEPAIASQQVAVDKLRSGLDRMRAKLTRLTSERDALAGRARSAPTRNRMTDAVRTIDVLDPATELGRFDDKVRREEARAVGGQELPASTLDAEFEQVESLGNDAEVEARLAALKSG
ncbi:PspA/IM30 family protein [Streptomyces griseus]|uniref:PspA/IM30 family protein n=1 Tax=Streptomyces griseus TaxID=1911 RepID=UPI0008402443|nr:PspA/IM30 family protein [Streptomyces griseus]